MTDLDIPPDDSQKVWRYLRFSRFLWLLQKKRLWLARSDTLDDPWELALTDKQLEFLISRHPLRPIDSSIEKPETAIERATRISSYGEKVRL